MKQPICDKCGEGALQYPLEIHSDNSWTKRGDRTTMHVFLKVQIADGASQGRGGEGELCLKCTTEVLTSAAAAYQRRLTRAKA